MPTIKEILHEERNRESGCVVMFLEGKFWKAYEKSAYTLTQLYNFKPSKRFIKLVGEEVISVGFPQEQLQKYLVNAVFEADGKRCRASLHNPQDELAFQEYLFMDEYNLDVQVKSVETGGTITSKSVSFKRSEYRENIKALAKELASKVGSEKIKAVTGRAVQVVPCLVATLIWGCPAERCGKPSTKACMIGIQR